MHHDTIRTLLAAAGGGGSASYLLPTLHYGFLPLVHTGDTHTHRGVLLLPCLLSPQASPEGFADISILAGGGRPRIGFAI